MLLKKNPIEFNWDRTTTDTKALVLIDQVYEDLNLGRQKVYMKKELLKTIIMNLLLSRKTARGIMYSRNYNWYEKIPCKYRYPFETYHFVIKVTDALLEKGYIVQQIGQYDMLLGLKEPTVMNPTEKLLRMFNTIVEYRQPVQEIILKKKVKTKVKNPKTGRMVTIKESAILDYAETPFTASMRLAIKQWNNLRANTTITMRLPKTLVKNEEDYMALLTDIIEETDEFTNYKVKPKYAYRVFTNDFVHFGRYAGASETLFYKEYRPYLKINDTPTVEIDFEAFHTRMLYHMKGIDYQDDPYQAAADTWTGELPLPKRKMFKKIAFPAINATSKNSAIKAVREKLLQEKQPIDIPYDTMTELLNHWLTTHELIGQYICSGIGLDLMFRDSQIAEKVIRHFTDRGIMILCVHDSFIAAREHKEELISEMKKAYREVMKCDYDAHVNIKELTN